MDNVSFEDRLSRALYGTLERLSAPLLLLGAANGLDHEGDRWESLRAFEAYAETGDPLDGCTVICAVDAG